MSPPPVTEPGRDELPAYLSNGLVGMRVLDIPLLSGVVLVNGFSGVHPVIHVEAAARAPYPIAGDIALNDVWLSTSPAQAEFLEQRYDFGAGELSTFFRYSAAGVTAQIEVLTFCSRTEPTVVLQEVRLEVTAPCDLRVRAIVDISKVGGRVADRDLTTPGQAETNLDGRLLWESLGGLAQCGVAYFTELTGEAEAERTVLDWGMGDSLATQYKLRARPGRKYRLRQMASLVPSALHSDPASEATRLVCRAADRGFDYLRQANRREWEDLWRSRVLIDSDDDHWQELADAAFFYLNSSVHVAAHSSTSIFGLAQWTDYHYYYGHVMWDIEMFCVPPLLLSQPDAARALLEYRSRTRDVAHRNAKLNGRRGLQFAWQSGPLHGEESAPGAGRASWHEDHVSLDIAWAFAQFSHATGDGRFEIDQAAPVLYGVADWIASRVTQTLDGFDWLRTMGIAERQEPVDNEAFTIMAAISVLREAIACAGRHGDPVPDAWPQVLAGLALPRHTRTGAILSHDDFHPNEEKGATPGPLAGLFPLWHPMEPEVASATLNYYLRLAPGYIGSPMLSALYGVWAAWAGNRRLSARLLDEGYGQLHSGRFLQALEQHPVKQPENPPAGPFFANLGGFLMGLLYGLPGIRVGAGEPSTWASRAVVLPAGWSAIEIERAWVRGKPAQIVARHGADKASIQMDERNRKYRRA